MSNRYRWLVRWTAIGMAAMAPGIGFAQNGSAQPAVSASLEDALHTMTERAGVIFVGTVTGVRRIAGHGSSSGAVEVTFAVEQAARGCVDGDTYTVREWAGLWMSNDQRYRVGQRLLMLLRAPGPGGLSAPVDGMNGAIPVHGTAAAVNRTSTSTADASLAAVADLRWISAAGATRPLTYPIAAPAGSLPGAHATPTQAVAHLQATGLGAVTAAEPVANTDGEAISSHPNGPGSAPAQGAAGSTPVVAGPQQPVTALLQQMAAWGVNRAR